MLPSPTTSPSISTSSLRRTARTFPVASSGAKRGDRRGLRLVLDVRVKCWHETDVPTVERDVRPRGIAEVPETGRHLGAIEGSLSRSESLALG
jgi:hypothetical protein